MVEEGVCVCGRHTIKKRGHLSQHLNIFLFNIFVGGGRRVGGWFWVGVSVDEYL